MKPLPLLALAFALGLAVPAAAQEMPGKADVARISGGTYGVDTNHTQIIWTVDHLGLSPLSGMFGAGEGTLNLDPKAPQAATLQLSIPISTLAVTSKSFGQDLGSPGFFDVAKFPSATFKSTKVTPHGAKATVEGELTLHGVTRPVTLEVSLFGAGINPRSKREEIGFTATATLRRSDFGLGVAVPLVSDEVKLDLVGVFRKNS
ncbi:YceI family protein [Ancylobacter mangrovi]|uniref:YceI family protein n=1 Tax=Ancylobacter mangrovi TaxID=2972472 RepID=UPI0021610CAD|nr:YceI family protein [Ancylobacter mangrovi]MCS0503867.1 YceI family protein [Ancylobacter mangrovi]